MGTYSFTIVLPGWFCWMVLTLYFLSTVAFTIQTYYKVKLLKLREGREEPT